MLLNIIKNKKASSTIYELLISLLVLTFMTFFPLNAFSYMRFQSNVNDIANLAMQMVSIDGQVTSDTITVINRNLTNKNYPIIGSGSYLVTNATAYNGTGVQGLNTIKYRNQSSTTIGVVAITLYVPVSESAKSINSLFTMFGSGSSPIKENGYYTITLYAVSEKYQW